MTLLTTTFETVHGDRRLRVTRTGRGAPVVLLHGYPDNLQIWGEVARRLASNFEVIAFDWPGMGDSDAWPGGATPTHMAGRLRDLLDFWHIERATIVGSDMGGQAALAFAALYAARVERVAVMNSLLFGDAETSWEISLLRRFKFNRVILGSLPRAVYWRAQHTFLPRGKRLPADLREDMWRCFRRPEVRRFIIRMCAGYQGALRRLPDLYRKITCPVLALWGERDSHFPPLHARRLAEVIPTCAVKVLEGAGHWMMHDRADEVAAALRMWAQASPLGSL